MLYEMQEKNHVCISLFNGNETGLNKFFLSIKLKKMILTGFLQKKELLSGNNFLFKIFINQKKFNIFNPELTRS
jgi:hypothetical protein